MNPPKVSVIIPTYNHGDLLPTILQSLKNQTFQNFEVIIINDGSTDRTEEYIAGITWDHLRALSHERNLGLPAALNTGMCNAMGEYVTWVSADNYCAPHFLEVLASTLDNIPFADIAFSAFGFIDESNNILGIQNQIDFSYANLITQNPGIASFMYRRIVHDQVGLYDTELFCAEDWDMWIRIIEHSAGVFVPDILYYYRKHSRSLTEQKKNLIQQNSLKAFWNTVDRAGGVLNLEKLYPLLASHPQKTDAIFDACVDFGLKLVKTIHNFSTYAEPFIEHALDIATDEFSASLMVWCLIRQKSWTRAGIALEEHAGSGTIQNQAFLGKASLAIETYSTDLISSDDFKEIIKYHTNLLELQNKTTTVFSPKQNLLDSQIPFSESDVHLLIQQGITAVQNQDWVDATNLLSTALKKIETENPLYGPLAETLSRLKALV